MANNTQWVEGCTTDWNASSAAKTCNLSSMAVNDTYENLFGSQLPYCSVTAICREHCYPDWGCRNVTEYTGTQLDMTLLVNCDGHLRKNSC